MSFHSWLQSLRSTLAPGRGQRQHRRRGSLRAATHRPHLEVLAELKQLRADTQKELEALQKVRTAISPSEKEALDENERQQNEVRERLANYRWQSAYFAWPTW